MLALHIKNEVYKLFIYIIDTASSVSHSLFYQHNDRVLSLVFLFIVHLRFPSEKSVAEVIHKCYNHNIVKQIHKFEKLDYEIRKNEADLEFLTSCQHNQLTPKFLNFKVASSNLRYSKTYRQSQHQLLK